MCLNLFYYEIIDLSVVYLAYLIFLPCNCHSLFYLIINNRQILMLRQNHFRPIQQRKVPLINLSSDEDSDSENQKENQTVYTTIHSTKPIHKSNILCENANNSNKHNNMQFSTLSLDQNSILEMDNQIKLLNNQKNDLMKDNEYLKRQIQKLKFEVHSLRTDNLNINAERQYQQRLESCYKEIQQLKSKYKKLQEDYRKAEKKYQNRLINQELPSKKTINDENNRIYKEITQHIKQICNRFIEELSKQKMNVKVQSIISNYVNELVQFNPRTNPSTTNIFGEYSSIKTTTPNRSTKLHQSVKPQTDSLLNISNDYRLLEKSIEKLRNMQRQIDSSSGTYLKKVQQKQQDSAYRSVCLDHSNISALDKSKSKRKRIFQ